MKSARPRRRFEHPWSKFHFQRAECLAELLAAGDELGAVAVPDGATDHRAERGDESAAERRAEPRHFAGKILGEEQPAAARDPRLIHHE